MTGPVGATCPVDALVAQQDELTALIVDRPEDQLLLGSRCPGWSAADVLLHLAQTNEMAIASVHGRLHDYVASVADSVPPGGDVDDWAGALVDAERSTPGAARERYLVSAAAQAQTFGSCDLHSRVWWVAGEMAARTLATTRLSETWIHTLDVGVAFDIHVPPTDRLWHVAHLVWRTVPYAMARAGTSLSGDVAFELSGPSGDTWVVGEPGGAAIVVRGSAVELCEVAGQRVAAGSTSLQAHGMHGDTVLAHIRTFA